MYGSNDKNIRLEMFAQLKNAAKTVNILWIVLGDFDCLANVNERKGQVVRLFEISPLRSYMHCCNINDMKFSGRFYMWKTSKVMKLGRCITLELKLFSFLREILTILL